MVVPEVNVAVLGPVRISGAALPFSRAAARELVVYLALHRQAVRTEIWAEALWPTRPVSSSTLHSAASDARRSLGRASDGSEHLPRGGRRLQLGAFVDTDVERFARLASGSDPTEWCAALELIRGPLFDDLTLSDWTVFDGTQAHLESMVVGTALKGAGRALQQGNGSDAEWMVRRALRISPYDERLYRDLLRAAEAQGNRVRLRATMAELLSLVTETGDPRDGTELHPPSSAFHPRTVALYRELTHGLAPAAGG